jgi:hypothetical protein
VQVWEWSAAAALPGLAGSWLVPLWLSHWRKKSTNLSKVPANQSAFLASNRRFCILVNIKLLFDCLRYLFSEKCFWKSERCFILWLNVKIMEASKLPQNIDQKRTTFAGNLAILILIKNWVLLLFLKIFLCWKKFLEICNVFFIVIKKHKQTKNDK